MVNEAKNSLPRITYTCPNCHEVYSHKPGCPSENEANPSLPDRASSPSPALEHSPLPWPAPFEDVDDNWVSELPDGDIIFEAYCQGNAELIWRSVNRDHAFTALVEALKECAGDSFHVADGMSETGKGTPAGKRFRDAMRALALAQPVERNE